MKTIILFAPALLLSFSLSAQGVKISQTVGSPDASAILEAQSNSQGFLPPRMNAEDRDAISNPAEGLMIYNTDENCFNYYDGESWNSLCSGSSSSGDGSITAFLNCDNPVNYGALGSDVSANGVSSVITYVGGNGGSHNGQVVNSTGVTGLTATLLPGSFESGTGLLGYTITGTPTAEGVASFAINIGGQACTLNRTVTFSCGISSVSFTYKGSSVTYGTIQGPSGKCWLNRNLGASQVATSATDANAYGDLFQWGRGDDGHQTRNSATTTTLSTTDQPGHGSFIRNTSGTQDWRSTNNNNLWQGLSGINNPCPSGWRIPTLTEWSNEGITNFSTAFSILKLTRGGLRDGGTGSVHSSGSSGGGYYWTSTPDGSYPRDYRFEGSNAAFAGSMAKAYGFSVRCVKN
jgi:hypothetical protein